MADAYIVDAVRSPTGRRKGGLSDVHGADLGAHLLKTLSDRNEIPDDEYASLFTDTSLESLAKAAGATEGMY